MARFGHPRRWRRHTTAGILAALLTAPLVVATATPADAVAGSLTLVFPDILTVGATGLPASITFQNTTGEAVSLDIVGMVSSCGLPAPAEESCDEEYLDPGVFEFSDATGVGGEGTTCDEMVFTASYPFPEFGVVYFSPSSQVIVADGETCRLDFTVDVVKAPTIDADPAAPGMQTYQIAGTAHDEDVFTFTPPTLETVYLVAPTLTTLASADGVVGTPISDTATLAGGIDPVGSITFSAYGPDDASCEGDVAFTATVPIDGNGEYDSGTFTPATPGTYRWVASYGADGTNAPVSGDCSDPAEAVVITTPVTPTPHVDDPPPPSPTGTPSASPTESPSSTPEPSTGAPTPEPSTSCTPGDVDLGVNVARITAGNAPTLVGTMRDAADQPCVSTFVTIFAKRYDATEYTPIATVSTDPNGRFSLIVRPLVRTAYGANTAGDVVRSNVVVVRVYTRLTLVTPAAPVSATSARPVSNPVEFTGSLSPAHANVAVGLATFVYPRFVVLDQAMTDASGQFAFTSNLAEGVQTVVVFTSPHGGNDMGARSIRLDVS